VGPRQIVLVGLSGVGKSSAAAALAARLGWPLLDTDDLVTQRTGRTPAQWITEDGEAAFRTAEERVIAEAVQQAPAIIATGGGAFQRPRNRRALGERGLICYLDAPATEIAKHIRSAPDASARPLLGDDLEGRLAELDRERRPFYMHADHWVPTLGLTPTEVAARIVGAWMGQGASLDDPRRLDRLGGDAPAAAPAAIVDTGAERYPIWVGRGEIARLPDRLRTLGLTGRVFLISDSNVIEAHGQQVAQALDGAGIAGTSYVVPAGEPSKSLRIAEELYGWLAAERAERGDVIVALGGGVVGDLAGHVAATYLRGMPLVQLPTSVLAMNDAAIGGKVAVDLPGGKNLVGAFHQPRAVLADIDTLMTLPRRAYIEGFAEVMKHALILDPDLLTLLERQAGAITPGRPDLDQLTAITARSIRLKALVVSADPREQGLRAILNYGHTIGHGIEAAAGYGEYLHGEAVAVGMMGASRIAARLGVADDELVARQADLFRAFGLPLTAPGVSAERVVEAMRLDKKVRGGQIRFVLVSQPGAAAVHDDIPEPLVNEVVRSLVAG